MSYPNIFIYGMSGAGKDTLANQLRDDFNYAKLRIALTIKNYVFETNGFESQHEFEYHKRQNKEIRIEHNIFGNQYDDAGLQKSNQIASLNRLSQIISKESLEFEITRNITSLPICIVDVRTQEEIDFLLKSGFIGIFLTRRNNYEYANLTHKTEQNLFSIDTNEFGETKCLFSSFIEKYRDNPELLKKIYIFKNDSVTEENKTINYQLTNYLKSIEKYIGSVYYLSGEIAELYKYSTDVIIKNKD